MTATFKLPSSHSTPWAFLPHLLHPQVRGSIVGPRAKTYFTCLPTRTSHLGLMELFLTRMFKLYSGSSIIISNPAPKCCLQLFQPLPVLLLLLKGIPPLPLHLTAQSVRLLRKLQVTLRVLCSKTRLVRKSCRIHPHSDFFLLIREKILRGNFVVPLSGPHIISNDFYSY